MCYAFVLWQFTSSEKHNGEFGRHISVWLLRNANHWERCPANVFLKAVLFLCWEPPPLTLRGDPKYLCFIYGMFLVFMKVARELAEAFKKHE